MSKQEKKQSNGEKTRGIQWHPAFYAGLQIELAKDAYNLTFENEHHLGTKPKQIDVLVVKKKKNIPVTKNIGKIFRTHNIIEYKDPDDYMSVDDFYQIYGYACFYKYESKKIDGIPIDEITITFVSYYYPKKMIEHLVKKRRCHVRKFDQGIYYIEGDAIKIQILVTNQLSEKENLWLKNLTNKIKKVDSIRPMLEEYQNHVKNQLYEAVMNVIVDANINKFKEEDETMCEALERLLEDRIVERELKAEIKGEIKGKIEGENLFATLTQKLIIASRMDDLLTATNDERFREKLYKEFNISKTLS